VVRDLDETKAFALLHQDETETLQEPDRDCFETQVFDMCYYLRFSLVTYATATLYNYIYELSI